MATGAITSIKENGENLIFSVTINAAVYSVVVSKLIFDALPTNLAKQNFIINVLSTARRINRLYEDIYITLIGNAIVIPD